MKKLFVFLMIMTSFILVCGCAELENNYVDDKKENIQNNDQDNSDNKENYFIVTFNTNGGTKIDEQSIKENNKIVKPTDPVKENYDFIGWYYNDLMWDFDKDLVTKNLTLDAKWVEQKTDKKIEVTGNTVLYYGYSCQLDAKIYPLTENQDVIWESSNRSILYVNNEGYVTALGIGVARIKCVSALDGELYSWHRIEVLEENNEETIVDMQGYKIVIMQASSALHETDPHMDGYKYYDKVAKEKAWDEVEVKYNCDLAVESYPDTAMWGTPRRTYIKDNAKNDNVPADIYTISSSWLYEFVDADTALDVSGYYEKYGKGQMEPGELGSGTIKDGLYIVSTGTDETDIHVDHGLYYNVSEITKYGVEDPATMFNEGRWNYTSFENWVNDLQASLPEGSYAIGGHPFYYWLGMTAAAGVKTTDYQKGEFNLNSTQSKNAMSLLNKLVVSGAMNTIPDWGEGGAAENGFYNETTLMTSGRFWFIHQSSRWYKGMWEEDEYPNIGYVPYPYPDNMNKEDTRITTTGGTVYMWAKGRVYGDGFGAEEVYRAINEMYLNTYLKLKTKPTYNPEEILYEKLSKALYNKPSIEAIMFYNSERVLFDYVEQYCGTSLGTLSLIYQNLCKVVYGGTDYEQALGLSPNDKFTYYN